MTGKRFRLVINDKNGVGLFNGDERLLYIRFSNFEDAISCKDALKYHCNLMNELHEENEQLKQFKEKVASVIESKMGDNVCNDYKMQVLKEVWNELNLDKVWFE